MEETSKIIAKALLEIKAVKLNVKQPFTWASGWKSPIYCDNRKILSYPAVRKTVYEAFAASVRQKYPHAKVIAGVATGAIAHGVLTAEALGLPFVYVRSAPKNHGLENLIEGELPAGADVVVIEDLISTGGSSLAAVEALRNAGANVSGMLAIFSYGFEAASASFDKADCQLNTLSNYSVLIEEAVKLNYVHESELDVLKKWRLAPAEFKV